MEDGLRAISIDEKALSFMLGKKTNLKKMKTKSGKEFSAKLYLEDSEVKFDFGGK